MLSFSNDVGNALNKARCHDNDNDAMSLIRLITKFSPTVSKLEGPNIEHQSHFVIVATTTTASHSIAQLLMFNSVKHTHKLWVPLQSLSV